MDHRWVVQKIKEPMNKTELRKGSLFEAKGGGPKGAQIDYSIRLMTIRYKEEMS